ncbi:hypothetical protein [Microcoleus asticus]|uniref:Serine/threonine protein kinase n=2 Tax=Microcoleus TaxID=44471 RepID=A0ABX2D035_9CYAN|nr:hypothetical protein [Microcoleus asticus IPMA8]
MNDPLNENLKVVLPENIAQKLERALAQLPKGKTAKIEEPTQWEAALNYVLLITIGEERYVFRARRGNSLEGINAYLKRMYENTGFLEIGGKFKLRTIAEEIDFISHALTVGLPVPKLIKADTDWMLIEYIEGKLFHELLEAGQVEILLKLLRELNFAHRQGIIYGDRWGKNEIIDSQGNVRLIDFEIEWSQEEDDNRVLEDLEMAFTIFSCLRQIRSHDKLLKIIQTEAMPMLKAEGYRISRMRQFIAGFSMYYVDPNKPSNTWTIPSDLYVPIAKAANRLIAIFAEVE